MGVMLVVDYGGGIGVLEGGIDWQVEDGFGVQFEFVLYLVDYGDYVGVMWMWVDF